MISLKHAAAGFVALGVVALSSGSASAMPNGLPATVGQYSSIENVRMVCNAWGRCWWRPNYYVGPPAFRYGYAGPGYYGRGWGYRRGWGRRW